jgi:hypothetical protein
MVVAVGGLAATPVASFTTFVERRGRPRHAGTGLTWDFSGGNGTRVVSWPDGVQWYLWRVDEPA